MIEVILTRNLRRDILRGHPWIYRQALKVSVQGSQQTMLEASHGQLAKLLDQKGKFLAWGILDPSSVIGFRVLSLHEKPPNSAEWKKRLDECWQLRASVRGQGETTGYRLINGEGDGFAGVVCDIYDSTAVIQFDGQGCSEFWDQEMIVEWLVFRGVKSVVDKSRMQSSAKTLFGPEISDYQIKENNLTFSGSILHGQKTGFFFDQRDNRQYVRQLCQELSVLNVFSYNGGFSVYAGMGGASSVTSVDLSAAAIDSAHQNWLGNGLEEQKHNGIAADAFDFLQQEKAAWDIVIVDPPSMASSEKSKERAIVKYVEVFSLAAKRLNLPGHLMLSSCSSHVSFADFFEIIEQTLSNLRRRGRILRVSGQGMDHPFPHVCPELRYLKFVHIFVY